MKQPWLKFFPGDWRGDLSLGPCSLAARGLWMEMLCIMSDATPRGSLTKDGEQYTTKRLAAVARASLRDVEKLLAELEAEGVFSRDPDGTIYSRRMRRDVDKAEQDRRNGGKGGNPKLRKDNAGVNPEDNGEDKAQKPESRSHKPEIKSSLRDDDGAIELAFGRFEGAYPKKTEPDGVRRELSMILQEGRATIEEIEAGAKRYAAANSGKDPQYIASPVRWLRDGRWKDGSKSEEPLLPIIEKGSPQGEAWDEYKRETTGKGMYWIGGRATVKSEWPPNHQPAQASAA